MIPGKQYSPGDFLRMAWHRKWLIVLPFVVLAVAAFVGARMLPNKYKSETLILVVPQRVPESYVRATVTARIEDRLQSISQQILSRPRLEKIIDDFGLYHEERKTSVMEDIVDRMRVADVDVQVVRGDAFRVSYIASDPKTAMGVVERLASLFIEENLRDREVQAEGTNQFLESQMEDARRRLIEHEQKLADYQREHSNDLPSQRAFNLQAQQSAELQLQSLVDSLNVDRDRRLVSERLIADASAPSAEGRPTGSPNGTGAGDSAVPSGGAAEQLEAARARLQAMQLRLKPEHPDIIGMKRLIGELEAKAAAGANPGDPKSEQSPAEAARERRVAGLRQELANLNQKLEAKEEQEKQLRAAIATYQSRIQAAPARDAELTELTRDYETIKGLYQSLLQKNEDSKLAANLERRQIGEQFKVIEPAHMPERPVSPDRTRINLIGAALGLAIGLTLAAVREYLDTSMRSEGDVLSALALPVLALVPFVESNEDRRRSRRARIVWGLTGAVAVVLGLAGLVWKLKA